ncbi:hypothetical protein BCIN_11g00670 [Botrytis cinerea B05.10]|uniref:Uncharacterized protein n=1 Tax=Botryotinia fuckeliana (strain B05.10) TaxID=332648 RepID=A0A384JW17_BOTFB|nr:hypothetical protein BCIN_11g00670 [Botrytis cinerea B05.10]ATZ54722.1 hypothetical protein BCIN_11g00670 [Botrytis cinerea B05.10]
MASTIIQTSKVLVLDLGEHATKRVLTEDDKLVEISAPFAFKLVHSAEKVKDPVTRKVTMCTEAVDYVWFYECLKERKVQERGKKASVIRSKDPDNISYYADMTHRPICVRLNEIKIKKTLGVLYSTDYKVSAILKIFEICSNICINRKGYKGYDDWIKRFAEQGLRDNIFRLAHEIRGLELDFKLPSSTDMIVDPAEGWLYDSKGKDHMLCCLKSGEPVLNKDDEFVWAYDLKKRKPKPTIKASAPVNEPESAPKAPPKKPRSRDLDNKQSERRRHEIEPPSQDSSREKLPSQRSFVEGIPSQGDSKIRPPKQGGSRDKIPSQRSSDVTPGKRNDPSDKNSAKTDPKVVSQKRNDISKSLEKKPSTKRTTSESRSTTKKPVAGRLQASS